VGTKTGRKSEELSRLKEKEKEERRKGGEEHPCGGREFLFFVRKTAKNNGEGK